MRKAILLFFIFNLSLFTLHAQSWVWGRDSTCTGYGDAWMDHSVSVDASGNMFYTGHN